LDENRNLIKYIFFNVITCGIYGLFFISALAKDANIICSGDGDETSGVLMYILLSLVTCGLYSVYWWYKLGNRLQQNAPKYGHSFPENGSSVLLWIILGYFLCGLGYFIAVNIVFKNINILAGEYNNNITGNTNNDNRMN